MKKLFLLLLALLALLFFPGALQADAAGARIDALRWTSRNDGDPPFVRIAMDLSKAVHAEAAMDSGGQNFELILRGTSKGAALAQYDMDKRAIDFATVSEKDGDTYLDIAFTQPQKMDNIRVFALRPDRKLSKPHRLVVDIPIIGATQTYKAPAKPDTGAKAGTAAAATKAATKSGSSKSTTYQASSSAKSALKGKIICIDPGHGGTDVGAIGQIKGKQIYEKDVTLAIAKPLRDMLTSAGAKVVMTRSTDKDVYGPYADAVPELQARCDIANEAHADVFVSIHIDSFSNSSVDGTTAYYYPKTSKDLLLAQLMHQATLSGLAIPDRGVRSNNLYVDVHTTMPSVLMEMGYISNNHRAQMLTSSWGAKRIAETLYDGLVKYFSTVK